jgi:hypothetical protein
MYFDENPQLIFCQDFRVPGKDPQSIFAAMKTRIKSTDSASKLRRHVYWTPISLVHSDWADPDFLSHVAGDFHSWQQYCRYVLGLTASDFKASSRLRPANMTDLEFQLFASLVFFGYYCTDGLEARRSDWIDTNGEIVFG